MKNEKKQPKPGVNKSSKIDPGFWVIILSTVTFSITIFIFGLKTCCEQPLISPSILGQFGDLYGGVVATIASIFAGVYLYHTYKNAKKDSDFQIINKLFDNIVHDINSLHFRIQYNTDWTELPPERQKIYTGIDALYNYNCFLHTNPNSVINHLNSILNSFENILYMADKKVLYKYSDMKEITLKRIYYLYYSHILWSVWEWEYPNPKKPNCEKEILSKFAKQNLHDDSKFIADKYAKLSIDTIKFLSERNLIEKKPNDIAKLEKLIMA